MEDVLMDLIREIGFLEDVDLSPSAKLEKYLDDLSLDELSLALEETYQVMIDPLDLAEMSIADVCAAIAEERHS